MPRQAVRVVLGRGGGGASSSIRRQQAFSTTAPRRRDGENSNGNAGGSKNNNGPSFVTRRTRSAAAASAIGAMTRPAQPSSSPGGAQRGGPGRGYNGSNGTGTGNGGERPHTVFRTLNLGRPGGASNVISVKSLPGRPAGAPKNLIQAPPRLLGGNSGGGSGRLIGRNGAGTGAGAGAGYGAPGSRPQFSRDGGRPGGAGFSRPPGSPSGLRPPQSSLGRRPAPSGSSRASSAGRGGGGGGRRFGKTRRGAKDSQGDRKRKVKDKGNKDKMDSSVDHYQDMFEAGGIEQTYYPKTKSLKTLLGYGPAVATNTALGQAEIAIRNMRIIAGGRGVASERESSFELRDINRWKSAGKPIMFSNLNQMKSAALMLAPGKLERIAERIHDSLVKTWQDKYGDDYAGFVKEYTDAGGLEGIMKRARFAAQRQFDHAVKDRQLQRTKNKTTREAITKFALLGDHPAVKPAEDTWGKLAMYAAHERSYRPMDAASFEAKVRTLVKA